MKKFLKNINIMMVIGVIVTSSTVISNLFTKQVLADSTPVVTKDTNKELTNNDENEVTVKLLASRPIKPEESKQKEEDSLKYDDIKVEDIKTAKVKDVVLGPKTRKKLGKEKQPEKAVTNTNTQNINRGGNYRYIPTTFNITFYTDGADENGGYAGMVANNKKIQPGMVAGGDRSQFGTKIVIPSFGKNIVGLEGINTFTIEDLMHSKEYSKAPNRIDVYVPRLPGEDPTAYSNRVNSYGRYEVKGYIVK